MLNHKVGYVKADGRDFKVEFWEDNDGLPWVRVSEVVTETYTSFGSRYKNDSWRKVTRIIDSGLTGDNRVEWATNRIKRYLLQEKQKKEEARQIAEFCRETVVL